VETHPLNDQRCIYRGLQYGENVRAIFKIFRNESMMQCVLKLGFAIKSYGFYSSRWFVKTGGYKMSYSLRICCGNRVAFRHLHYPCVNRGQIFGCWSLPQSTVPCQVGETWMLVIIKINNVSVLIYKWYYTSYNTTTEIQVPRTFYHTQVITKYIYHQENAIKYWSTYHQNTHHQVLVLLGFGTRLETL
jgi:hypothetical protein